MGRGTFKYICEDCGEETWLTQKDRASRFKPRCIHCGSLWLEPSRGSKASNSIAEHIDASHEQRRIIKIKMNKE